MLSLSPFRTATRQSTSARVANIAFLRRTLATQTSIPQTLIEKIVQNYAVDLPAGKKVRSGDYIMIRPEHVLVALRISLVSEADLIAGAE